MKRARVVGLTLLVVLVAAILLLPEYGAQPFAAGVVQVAAPLEADSLTVMARAVRRAGLEPAGTFAISVDAHRDKLYLGLFDSEGTRLEGPLLCAPDDAVRRLPEGLSVAAGNGARLLAEAAAAHGRALEPALPDLQPGAVALAELAGESTDRLEILRPLYLRPPDAKPQRAALERRL